MNDSLDIYDERFLYSFYFSSGVAERDLSKNNSFFSSIRRAEFTVNPIDYNDVKISCWGSGYNYGVCPLLMKKLKNGSIPNKKFSSY
ncbi:hypothetical protein Dip510_001313 [Elusimicrobium posterum]|uniref:hypothetical protein n=1 Tax=Elusimicrobium posterum TaxID=3116653 RepID=UPI003C77DD65